MQVTAQLNNLRISPRKVRLVSKLIKGMDAVTAKYQLEHLVKKSSKPISKLLDSAMANAHNNFNLVKNNLFIKDIVINEGRKLKRFKAKGFGSVSPIEKKTSRIRIVLEEKVPGLKSSEAFVKAVDKMDEKTETIFDEHAGEAKSDETKNQFKKEQERKNSKARSEITKPEFKKEATSKSILGRVGKLGKKFFRRKTI